MNNLDLLPAWIITQDGETHDAKVVIHAKNVMSIYLEDKDISLTGDLLGVSFKNGPLVEGLEYQKVTDGIYLTKTF